MYVLLLVIWTVISVVMMIGYRFFSGDGAFPPESIDIFIGAPIAIIIFLAFAKNRLLERAPNQLYGWIESFTKGVRIFALWLVLPILMNALSTFAKLLELTNVADNLFNLRYHSLWLSALLVIAIISLYHLKKPA
ncbi:MAG: hypothetical protein LiPW41_320 [Parcubacteria group bacterium LiPW_41]|nr:MAG: hypothetical protein LiPW41_320 [Parcubacteria group bacterium LiPW_41]